MVHERLDLTRDHLRVTFRLAALAQFFERVGVYSPILLTPAFVIPTMISG